LPNEFIRGKRGVWHLSSIGPSASRHAVSFVPVYWIVNLVDRRLEVYSEPDSGGYRARQLLTAGQHVSVVIAGTEIGRIAVADLLP
jgi:hypothetical protein